MMGGDAINSIQLARRFVTNDWGGTETVIFETSKQLLAMGHPTEILCTLATADSAKEDIDGLHVRRFPYFYPYLGLSEDAKRLLDRKGGSPFSFKLTRALFGVPDFDLIHLHISNQIGGIGRYVARTLAVYGTLRRSNLAIRSVEIVATITQSVCDYSIR